MIHHLLQMLGGILMKKNHLVRLVLASLSALVLAIGLSACSLFQGESIDGSWTSPTGAEAMYQEALVAAGSEEVFTYSDHTLEEILTKAELDLVVKEDKATMSMSMHIDSDAFFTALKDEQMAAVTSELEKMGYTYEELDATTKAQVDASLLSDEDIQKLVDESIDQMASSLNGTYDAETGIVTADVFEADVNRSNKTFEITSVNSAVGEGLITTGESYQYSYKDSVLTLEGETDADDIVFEKE